MLVPRSCRRAARRPGLALVLALAAAGLSTAHAGALRGPEGRETGRSVAAEDLFTRAPPGWAQGIGGDLAAVATVAEGAAAWIRAAQGQAPSVGAGLPAELGLDLDTTLVTLDNLARIVREDAQTGARRLEDPAFLEAHFALYRWAPDAAGAKAAGLKHDPERIRLTRYYVTRIEGRRSPEGPYQHALYADPGPEARLRHARPEIIGGAWAAGGATPLVWLTEAQVYEAQMQGTVEVRFPDGSSARYNVHQHNGRPYKRGVSRASQPRYWYFREVDAVLGWGEPGVCEPCGKIPLQPHAAVAGDVWNLGPGRLIWIETPTGPRLAVLADSGGAFSPNLFQLDWFGGAHATPAALYAATRDLPGRVRAGLLVWTGGVP